ncbi:MAG: methyltransferase domain-containing protein [Candidatus Pacebacteria bacterium]|nr:methyltransferase domain-containing protein [Candidatus Paceibacterota bacterium]
MLHRNKKILDYWNDEQVESMYDKHLLRAEIEMIKKRITPGSKILDAGCGEGEGTIIYSAISGTIVHAVDFSETRLKKAARRLKRKRNVTLKKVDFLQKYDLDNNYDIIISQRFLINLMQWRLQKKVLLGLMGMLKKGGRFLMLEGNIDGVKELNKFRKIYFLKPIPIKWHNLFFKNKQLVNFMESNGFKLIEEDGLGEYFLLTRGIRPLFDKDLNWKTKFNKISASEEVKDMLSLHDKFSRLKLWVFKK